MLVCCIAFHRGQQREALELFLKAGPHQTDQPERRCQGGNMKPVGSSAKAARRTPSQRMSSRGFHFLRTKSFARRHRLCGQNLLRSAHQGPDHVLILYECSLEIYASVDDNLDSANARFTESTPVASPGSTLSRCPRPRRPTTSSPSRAATSTK